MGEVFISYAWGGESEAIANALEKIFQEKGIKLVRDKTDLGYKGLIREFMQQIGQGKCVVAVISDKYLKSKNCMYELLEIYRNGEFYDRIFPIVLKDARIYTASERMQYIKYWEEEKVKLSEIMKKVDPANLRGIYEEIDLYTEIRHKIEGLMNTLQNINALTLLMHQETGFEKVVEAIAKRLEEDVKRGSNSYTPKWQMVMATSLAVTSLFLGVRHLGWLQPLELKAYDQMIQLRPNEKRDDRILVVEVTKADIKSEEQKGSGASSLTVSTLTQLLAQIQKDKPKFIGLVQDLDTPDKISSKQNLKKLFEENPNLYGICSSKDANKGDPVGSPLLPGKVGFSDVSTDNDGVLRRSLWYQDSGNPRCQSPYAFSLVLALLYLEAKGIQNQSISYNLLEIGNVILSRLEKRAGGYQKLDARGYQMLLNYRIVYDDDTSSRRLDKIAKDTPVENFLSSSPAPELANLVKDRIVLIGVTDEEFAKDKLIQTPYNQKIAPVWIHAQMVSQILSAVEDERPLLTVWSDWENFFWIFAWSFVGGLIVWRVRSSINVALITGVVIFLLYGSCFLLFLQGFWVPLVPSVLILITISGIFIIVIPYWQKKK